MANRADLRARIRRELRDVAAVQTWQDDQLNDAIADACQELGREVPRPIASYSAVSVAGQRDYTIGSAAYTLLVGVEYPDGLMLPRAGDLIPADTVNDRGYAQEWAPGDAAGEIRLRNAPTSNGQAIRIYLHPMIAAPTDDTTAIAVAGDEVTLLALLACRELWLTLNIEEMRKGVRWSSNPFERRIGRWLARRRQAHGSVMAPGARPVDR
jgi:hypothetical protein